MLKGSSIKTTRKIDCRKTSGPLIPKGTTGNVIGVPRHDWHKGEVYVNLVGFGQRYLKKEDVTE